MENLILNLATDHAGFTYKEAVKVWLMEKGCHITDHGAFELDPEDDFTDFISLAGKIVSQSPVNNRAIIFGGSGNGEAMLANRFLGVRACVYYGGNLDIIRLSREHNESNILSLGARFMSLEEVKEAITLWLNTEVLKEEKRQRRNLCIDTITREFYSA
jgi:ribose 5-phosphate isomerase B